MKRNIKKVLSVVLVVVMAFSIAVPAMATYEEYPTIYVTGAQTNQIYNAEGQLIYPFAKPIMEVAKDIIAPTVKDLIVGNITGNFDAFNTNILGLLDDVFGDVKLDKNGEASDGSHPEFHSSTVAVSEKKGNYGMWDFRFWYDWRLSPVDCALELKNYIDRVKEATGKDKVQLVGRC